MLVAFRPGAGPFLPQPTHNQQLHSILQPLRLRCRSAAFAVARWDFISILLAAKRAKSLFKRAGDGFLRGIVFFARCSLFARLARFIYIRLIAETVESLL